MPGKIGVKIKAARNLPVMDKSSDTTDAFVEIKLGNVTHKTDVCRKSLNPTWNTDWYRFEVDDAELQDEPLQIRLMDYDTYSANDAIGKVNISLNPLCLENAGQSTHGKSTVLSGWIPVFDTMHGIRGEINVIVKVDLFSDVNKFRQSSCGIPFFHSQCVPHGYRVQIIHGFVEELVVNDDPEYQWIDKIRTPRASNEARQVVFLKLSGQVQRKMGLKAINMGANAVIGYTQCFDLEGDVGVVARGVGTAVTLIKDVNNQPTNTDAALIEDRTQKYLDFLTCNGAVNSARYIPQYRLSINRSQSSTMFYLESGSSENDDAEIMQNLIRQEDERGERAKKKLQNRMRRLTRSSRSIFSEKYSTLIRRIEPKIPEHASYSLSNFFANKSSVFNLYDNKRQQSHTHQQRRMSFKKSHTIVRSISEDTAVKQGHNTTPGLLSVESISTRINYQENTRSAPDICAQQNASSTSISGQDLASSSSCSMDTISLTDNFFLQQNLDYIEMHKSDVDSDSERDDLNDDDLDDELEQQWIKPGETFSGDESPNEQAPKHTSLLQDLKAFSKRLQKLVHLTPSKVKPIPKPMTNSALFRLEPTELKSYYSSQPEIPTACEFDLLASTPYMRHALSLNNFACKFSSDIDLCSAAEDTGFETRRTPPKNLALNKPILCICPSTPTPTDSDQIKLSPPLPPLLLPTDTNVYQLETAKCISPPISRNTSFDLNNDHFVNISNTNLSNKGNESSLLAPCFSVSSSLAIQKCQLRSNELQPTTAPVAVAVAATNSMLTTAECSPKLKRLTSPLGSRNKLSPSPSKSGISAGTVAASDSASTSTTSTATTMVPKEVGEICRRSSDSDLSVTPKGNSICVASERLVAATAMMRLTQAGIAGKTTTTDSLDMLEYPFLTMTKYPSGFILHLGATVAARSVKLLERVPNPDEPEVRDSWWTELRMEIRSHARSLGCNVVLGYSESTTISDDVCVLSATGTAAVINMVFNRSVSQTDIFNIAKTVGVGSAMSASLEERDGTTSSIVTELNKQEVITGSLGNTNNSTGRKYGLPPINAPRNTCTMCHIPYNLSSVPFNIKMRKCAVCHKGRVPDVLLATLELPEYIQVTGRGCFMQAQVVRAKKDLRAELNAKEISDGLPFLEYELHRVLINKLKAKGMNAIFGLKTQVAIGERMIALIATGTALFLTALPVPQVPKIVAGNSWTDKQKLNELQKKLQETFERNQEIYQLKCLDPDLTVGMADKQSDTDDSDEEEINEIDLNCGNKELCVLEVDDIEDLEIISLLMEPYPPEGFHVVNTQQVPGMSEIETVKNLQMFTQVWRARLDVGQNVTGFPKHFQRLLQTIYFKLRTMIPCAICDLRFRLDLPESDQIQLLVTGMALGLNDANKMKYRRKANIATAASNQNGLGETGSPSIHASQTQLDINGGHPPANKRTLQEEDYIFPLDEDDMINTPTPTSNIPPFGMSSFKMRKTSPSRAGITHIKTSQLPAPRNRYFPLRDRTGVDITPLSFIPGGRIEKYLGNLNFFFIRESTSIRENGGISGFVHGFITELLAVVRAHIAAIGGNAMVSFYMTELILFDNQHKNQGQCLISLGGDAVYVSYYTDD